MLLTFTWGGYDIFFRVFYLVLLLPIQFRKETRVQMCFPPWNLGILCAELWRGILSFITDRFPSMA
jgi:hypothetical protein